MKVFLARSILSGALLLACMVGAAEAAGLKEGIALYSAGKYSEARPILESAVKASPYDPTAHYYLGMCYLSQRQISLAKQHFDWVAANSKDERLRGYAQKAAGACVTPQPAGSSRSVPVTVSRITQAVGIPENDRLKQLGRCKVLMFETSWCHYCHEFAPEFDEAARKYRGVMDFQHVDAEDPSNFELKEKYSITGFPRLVYLDGRGNVLYNEGRGAFAQRLRELTGR